MNHKAVIMQGSSRSNGNTRKISDYVVTETGFGFIDLCEKSIGYFDYDFANREDDFLPLMNEIVTDYDTLIFTTPIYWYSMSAVMKTFFDRISDLLIVEKELGRSLRGKNMAMISCSGDSNLPEGFAMPFSETANYLGMKYLGDAHTWVAGEEISGDSIPNLNNLIAKLV